MENLLSAADGEKVKVIKIEGSEDLSKRLKELGIYEGAVISVLKNDGINPIIVKVFQSRIAIGRNEAEKVIVD